MQFVSGLNGSTTRGTEEVSTTEKKRKKNATPPKGGNAARMSFRRSHGGLLADKAAQRAGSKFPNCVGTLAGASGGEAVTSAVATSDSDKRGAFDLVPSRDDSRIQVTE